METTTLSTANVWLTIPTPPALNEAWLILGIVLFGLIVSLCLFARDDDSTKY